MTNLLSVITGLQTNSESVMGHVRSMEEILEQSLGGLADQIRKLKTPGAADYADCVLCESGYRQDTANIYFYLYAGADYTRPSDKAFQSLVENKAKYQQYQRKCFEGWLKEIRAVRKVLGPYGGRIFIGQTPLDDYVRWARNRKTFDTSIIVRLDVPGQEYLGFIKEVKLAHQKHIQNKK